MTILKEGLFKSSNKLQAETLDYKSRIIAASSTISNTSLAAWNKFIIRAKGFGLWSKYSEVGAISGSNLTAALVKLKYPGGISGTLTNINYVSGDYTEATGLTGTGTQYLKTGWIPSVQITSSLDAHFSIYARNFPANASSKAYIGARSDTGARRFWMRRNGGLTTISQFLGASDHGITAEGGTGLITCSNVAANDGTFYLNNAVAGIDGSGFSSNLLPTVEIYINAYNLDTNIPANQGLFTIAGYTLGTGLNAIDAANHYTIWQELQTSLGRQV